MTRGGEVPWSGREPLTERHVQAVWYDRALRPDALRTRRGQAVRVIHPGRWNLGPGPDFRDAVLEIGPDGRRVRGDVEVHVNPSDWMFHGHGYDPAYRQVVAHVTWCCGPEPATLPPGAVSIALGRFLTAETGFAPEQIDLAAYPFARLPAGERPCFARYEGDPDAARALLAAAGRCRLETKARRLRTILAWRPGERRQVFYEEVMNALGYSVNSRAFREVARRVRVEELLAEPETAAPALLAAGGFVEWNRAGLRPSNRPEARLAAAAGVFTRTRTLSLVEADAFGPEDCRAMIGEMTRWHLMGRGRAAAVLANVILPFALAEGRIGTCPDRLPPEDLSQPVRLTAYRLLGRDHNPAAFYAANGLHIQGLIQIHRAYCLQVHPDCAGCALGEAPRDGPHA